MAQFRVGQRVRVVDQIGSCEIGYIGAEGVIAGRAWDGWLVEFGRRMHRPSLIPETQGYFLPEMLIPLTDPLADAFIERIRKLQPLKEPVDA